MRRLSIWTISSLLAIGLLLGGQPEAPIAAGSPIVQIYVTPKGKTYHTHRDCIGLTRSRAVFTASEHDAQIHGLTLCGICAHRHHAQAVNGQNSSWAAKEAK